MPTIRHLQGDCLEVLREIPDASVQLIVTSPPYAEARKDTYGGWGEDVYVKEFQLRSAEFKRVLKPKGTFILNIKENVVGGVRHRYVRDLLDALEEQGWLFTEEWIWHKKNCVPGKWPNRFRDAWEHIFQFNLERQFDMHQDAVKVPVGEWAEQRIPNLSEKDHTRDMSGTGSSFAKNVSNWADRDLVYPSNVLHLASETGDKKHSAAFPVSLPSFFVKLFSRVEETVLDPFAGSGSTGVAAARLRRSYIGIDRLSEFITLARARIVEDVQAQAQLSSLEYVETDEEKEIKVKAKDRADEIARLKREATEREAIAVSEDGIFKLMMSL